MPNFEYTLRRLAVTFTARDVMQSMEDLVCGSDEIQAKRLLGEYLGYDVIPIKQNGALTAYLERGCEKGIIIRPQHIISDATSILDLVDMFQHRQFLFVLVRDAVTGYIHHSDLNNRIVKIPYFVIFEAFEQCLLRQIGELIGPDVLEANLDEKEYKAVKDRMSSMQKNRTDLTWADLLHFSHLIKIACNFEKLKLHKRKSKMLIEIRNKIAHAGRMLIKKHADVVRLAEAKNICIDFIQDTNSCSSILGCD